MGFSTLAKKPAAYAMFTLLQADQEVLRTATVAFTKAGDSGSLLAFSALSSYPRKGK